MRYTTYKDEAVYQRVLSSLDARELLDLTVALQKLKQEPVVHSVQLLYILVSAKSESVTVQGKTKNR